MPQTNTMAPSDERTPEEEITLRSVGQESEVLVAAAFAVDEKRPSERNPDDEITLDAPAPVSTPPASPMPMPMPVPVALAVLVIQPATRTRPRMTANVARAARKISATDEARRADSRATLLAMIRHPQAGLVVGIWTLALALAALVTVVIVLT
ncbi:MAG: hypothetical protein JWO86_9216 [Myxococcaceae bacterium]|jgi:hypothetical protein|nr:hypothetical protein [Myxococcaceae bacterium]MEA2747782.1 hypothetical protein [Myxococcales bacterium]